MREHWNTSYPMLLRKAGYRTAIAGKVGFEVANAPGEKGELPEGDFDMWGGGPGQTFYETAKNKSMAKYAEAYPHSTLSYAAFSRDFIAESVKTDAPFCLSISFKAAHRPDTPDPKFDPIYKDKVFKKPANYGREHGQHFSKQSQQGRQYTRFEEWKYDSEYDDVMRRYHQQVYAVDVAVGMIRDALKEHGVAENTVIIFTSDNGFLCGSHGYGSKVLPYEEASRVPLIMYDPRHKNSGKGLRSDALTGNIDFAPTLLELGGVAIPDVMDGKSLLPIYDDPEAAIHEALPLINVWGPKEVHSLAVVTRDFKYVYWNYGAEGFEPTEELFHTAKDPLELTNAALNPEYQAQLEAMRKRYDAAVAHWKKEAVPYNNYQPFGVIFDRSIPWTEKMTQLNGDAATKKGRKRKK
jgi:arylsulfatase A-like enzyme